MASMDHQIVKKSLSQFIKQHIPKADLKIVDDIVLQYVVSILEEASEDPCFDVEGFIEMMSAYFEEFANIDQAVICTWIFELEGQLSKINKKKSSGPTLLSFNSLSLTDMIPEEKLRGRQVSMSSTSSIEVPETNGHVKRVQHLSETSDGSTDSSNCDLFIEECDTLQEMFPESTFIEIKYCMAIANGDVERGTQILLHRQETGQSLHNSNSKHGKVSAKVDEKTLKNRIIDRYSYVDLKDTREYKPLVPKVEPKKMIRYRDNKIVSLRGEKFTEKDGELKKTKKQQIIQQQQLNSP